MVYQDSQTQRQRKAARAVLRLARCCASRRLQLERLAERCDDIGLDPQDVELLSEVARSYGAFHDELRRIYNDLDIEARAPAAATDATVDEAFRDVMESPLSRPLKREVRRAYRDNVPSQENPHAD